jgi:putative SOS response-associated peptidase YedK
MCGRYSITTLSGLDERFDAEFPDEPLKPRYNAAPTQNLVVITESDPHKMVYAKWGFPISWMKDKPAGLINMRIETLKEKPSFKKYLENRCLILADGFYEWKKESNGKQPFRITLKNGEPFAMAGVCREVDGNLRFAIITTEPNEVMKPIHTRMPVILEREEEKEWLNPDNEISRIVSYALSSYPAKKMVAVPISNLINSPQNDNPEVLNLIF